MRFSLQDVKKSVQRRGSDLSVSLHFLRPGELHTEIERLITYHERLLGQAQCDFSLDDARACIGDYRLAHCLLATLSHWYGWRQREWDAVLQELPVPPLFGDIASPVQLRLALYTYVNEHYHGFLDAQTRTTALQALAEIYQVSRSDLEYLLVLDSEEHALLVRETSLLPTAQEVATLYNQGTFESALFNASRVHFVIDCNAFSNAQQQSAPLASSAITTGVGMVIKRLCYLARKLGVYYDLAYDVDDGGLRSQATRLRLTLYGPQEVTGAPQQYGLRLARLCRLLLDYGVTKHERTKKGRTLSTAIIEAEATVHFLQRAYSFRIDAPMLQLLPPIDQNNARTHTDVSTLFDSSIEQSFSEAFSALATGQGVDGWRLEREPEPLLLAGGIFIPDFALTRGQRRIYVEILGFWTPAYRERKIQKLHQLQGRNDLLLAIPVEARAAFTSIAAYFPIVYYDGQLSATEVLQLLRVRYDDFAQRLELIDVPTMRERVRCEDLLPERLCYDLLHAYRRSELQQAAAVVIDEDIAFMPGIGLYSLDWLRRLNSSFMAWMYTIRTTTLSEAIRELRACWPILAACEDTTIEALFALWPTMQVRRTSIFEAVVEIVGEQEVALTEVTASTQETKKPTREKRATAKKRSTLEQEPLQGDLWG